MGKIAILPDQVANQIAAGEVVERPASVIKELVENSIDAGAKHIEVEFRNGGKSYLRIEDDGCGMSPQDALLSLERHATSKLKKAQDLEKILSFGFRGEAVPSIASVSKFTLQTREQGSEVGTEILISAGKLIRNGQYGMKAGTRITVENLFNSLPARRKFLKTDATESSHIVHMMKLFAVANLDVAFTLLEGKRVIFRTHEGETLQERANAVWGEKVMGPMQEITQEGEEGLKMHGLIGSVGVGRRTAHQLLTFVNGRPVDNRLLNHAIIESYHSYMPKGTYPSTVLFFEMNPKWVDVNVHPAKREVRFNEGPKIRQFIVRTLLDNLRDQVRARNPLLVEEEVQPEVEAPEVVKSPQVKVHAPVEAARVEVKQEAPAAVAQVRRPKVVVQAPQAEVVEAVEEPLEEEKVVEAIEQVPLDWRLIGRFDQDYAMFESESGLVLLYIKAARQRVCYERIVRSFNDSRKTLQPLLIGVTFKLESRLGAVLEEHMELFQDLGIEIDVFGRCFYKVDAVADWLDPSKVEDVVRDIAGALELEGGALGAKKLVLEEMARRAAVQGMSRVGDMSEGEVIGLAQALINCKDSLTCPRGRPTYVELSKNEVKRRFEGKILVK